MLLVRKWDVTREVEALWQATKELPRGAIVEHKQIEELTGHKKDKVPWQSIIKKWKNKFLQERGVSVVAIGNGVGYRLLTAVEQQTKWADSLEKSGDRKHKQALAAVSLIPESELTESQILYSHARASQLTDQIKLGQTQRAQRQSWLSAPETLPRITNGKKS